MKIDEYAVSLIKHSRLIRASSSSSSMSKDGDFGPDPPTQSVGPNENQANVENIMPDNNDNVEDRKPDENDNVEDGKHDNNDNVEDEEKENDNHESINIDHQPFTMTANTVVYHIPSTTFSSWDRITFYLPGHAPDNGQAPDNGEN